jgi:hypothetical protein
MCRTQLHIYWWLSCTFPTFNPNAHAARYHDEQCGECVLGDQLRRRR